MKFVAEPSRNTPVLIEADVAVCGGGPAGIAAALSSARNGARTVLIEKYGFLGGMGTAGLVASFAAGYYDSKRFIIEGIFREFRDRLLKRGALIEMSSKGWEPFNPEIYKILAFECLQEAGVTLLCHSYLVDAVRDGDRIHALIVESKAGRHAIQANCYVDASGDGDLAARAGIEYSVGRDGDGLTQPHTLMYYLGNVDLDSMCEYLHRKGQFGCLKDPQGRRFLHASAFREELSAAKREGMLASINRDHVSAIFSIPWIDHVVGVNYGRVSGSALDPIELTNAEIMGRKQVMEGIAFFRKYLPGFEKAELLATGPQIGVRETRRIVGDYAMTQEDIVSCRQFDDVIAQSCYMIDIHLPNSDKTTFINLEPETHYDIPYRSLLPRGVDNLLLAGRCISATHEALGSFRVQAVCLALGEAAGTAAALAIQENCTTRQVPIGKLQEALIQAGAKLD